MLEYLSYLIGIPLAYIYAKTVKFEGRISKAETNISNIDSKIDKVCKSNNELIKEVHELIGQFKEHSKLSKI